MNQSPTIENNPPDGGFSARLAQLIQVLGMSQNEFSRRIESTSAYVSNMTTGKTVLVKPRRTLLSENFHTPMDSFHCWLYEAV